MIPSDVSPGNDTARWSGRDLRLYRLDRRVKLVALARHYGVSRQRLRTIEIDESPTSRAIERYLRAVLEAEAER